MKKISIIIIAAIIFCFLVFKIIDHQIKNNIIQNTTISESITDKTIPNAYTTISAFSKKGSKIALLTSTNEHTVLLIEGTPIKTKKNMLEIIEKKLSHFNKGPLSTVKIKPANNLQVESNILPKYEILIKNKDTNFKGIATFINYTNKTVLFICLAKESIYEESNAVYFLKNIKLPNQEKLF